MLGKPVRAAAEEIEHAEIPEDLKLLPDLSPTHPAPDALTFDGHGAYHAFRSHVSLCDSKCDPGRL